MLDEKIIDEELKKLLALKKAHGDSRFRTFDAAAEDILNARIQTLEWVLGLD